LITDALLTILNGLLDWLLTLRPEWTMELPAGVTDFVRAIMAYDAYVPITEGLNCISLLCTCVLAVTGWKWSIKLIDWIADIIP
jgi:hypothetical protein